MVRKYVRKPGRVNPDRRMARAVELRAEGLSLRQIAERLSVKSPQTIANDLKRWDREHANVTPLLSKTTVQKTPHGGDEWTPVLDTADPNVISLTDRRKRA